MVRRSSTAAILVVVLVLSTTSTNVVSQTTANHLNLVFNCRQDNDLYQVVTSNSGQYPRYSTTAKAIKNAREGAGVLILADGYPDKTTIIDNELFELAVRKKLRLYVEYPSSLPGM